MQGVKKTCDPTGSGIGIDGKSDGPRGRVATIGNQERKGRRESVHFTVKYKFSKTITLFMFSFNMLLLCYFVKKI